jgi:hypothetical protein
LIGSLWLDSDLAAYLDKTFLGVFSGIFILIHIILFTWLFNAYGQIRKLKKDESIYLKENQKS